MRIVTMFEQLARTAHHRVNINALLNEEAIELKELFVNNDASSLRALLNKKVMPADRNTIFDL